MSPLDENPVLDLGAGRLDHLFGLLRGDAARQPGTARVDLETVQSEAEGMGRSDLAEALGRLVSLTEVEECLAPENPEAAREITAFRLDAIDRLSASSRGDADGDAPAAILRESAARWSDYLGLLDPWSIASSEPEDDLPFPETDEPAIDPGMLLRLLTGASPAPISPAAPDSRDRDEDPLPSDPVEEDPSAGWLGSVLGPQSDGRGTGVRGRTPATPTELLERISFGLTTGRSGLGGWGPSSDPGPSAPGSEDGPQPPGIWSIQPRSARTAPIPGEDDGSTSTFPEGPHSEPIPAPTIPAKLDLDPEFREAFLAEAFDLFERIEAVVLELDRDPCQPDALGELGRCYHTLKGAAGSVGMIDLAVRIHALEERLEGAGGTASADLLDQLHGSLRDLEASLIQLRQSSPAHRSRDRRQDRLSGPPDAAAGSLEGRDPEPPTREEATPAHAASGPSSIRVPAERIDNLIDLVSELISRRGAWTAQGETVKRLVAQTRGCRDGLRNEMDRLHDRGLFSREPIGRAGSPGRSSDPDGQIRRLTERTEDLTVLAEATQAAALPLADDVELLARLTLQLWDALQAIRIVPARGLFQRLARVAHDAARVEGRRVDLKMVGDETGLDRAVQEKAFEPLLHIVRNAVGHGIETPEERVRAGKPAQGRITLEAVREGNTLVLSVQDDGRGLDYEAIAAKGRRLGLLRPDETPSTDRLNALVFVSGFSTRQEANAISGRGVGMDVVAQEVARLRGTIELASQPGRGTRIILRLPARLALEQMIVVRVDGQPFAVPVSLIEHAQPFEPEAVACAGMNATVLVRDDRVPLIVVREVLGFSTSEPVSCSKLLLVRAEGEAIALVVDAIEGARELVIKPLGTLLAGHPVLSGTSQSVTGEVILVLNPSGLSRWQREGRAVASSSASRPKGPAAARVLVVDDSISVRKVVARELRMLGAEVEEVSDGLEALGKLRTQVYRLVLTDLEMPRMDGFELLAELRRWTDQETPPVIVSSTVSDPATRRRVLDLGARAFVPKPIDRDELARAVSGLI